MTRRTRNERSAVRIASVAGSLIAAYLILTHVLMIILAVAIAGAAWTLAHRHQRPAGRPAKPARTRGIVAGRPAPLPSATVAGSQSALLELHADEHTCASPEGYAWFGGTDNPPCPVTRALRD